MGAFLWVGVWHEYMVLCVCGGQKSTLGIFVDCSSCDILRQTQSSTIHIDWLASKLLPLPPLDWGLQGSFTMHFQADTGYQTQVPTPVQQTLICLAKNTEIAKV